MSHETAGKREDRPLGRKIVVHQRGHHPVIRIVFQGIAHDLLPGFLVRHQLLCIRLGLFQLLLAGPVPLGLRVILGVIAGQPLHTFLDQRAVNIGFLWPILGNNQIGRAQQNQG